MHCVVLQDPLCTYAINVSVHCASHVEHTSAAKLMLEAIVGASGAIQVTQALTTVGPAALRVGQTHWPVELQPPKTGAMGSHSLVQKPSWRRCRSNGLLLMLYPGFWINA